MKTTSCRNDDLRTVVCQSPRTIRLETGPNGPIVYRIGAPFVLGSIVGLVVGEPATVLQPLGDIFVRLLSMIVIPIVVFTLIMGVRRISPSTLGKVGGQVVVLYAVMSAIAVFIGLAVANVIDPGAGLELADVDEFEGGEAPDFLEVLIGIVPENPIDAIPSR